MREKQRLANLEKKQVKEASSKEDEVTSSSNKRKKPATAWSQQKETKIKRQVRGEKREKRRVAKSMVKQVNQEDAKPLDWKHKVVKGKV